jgi:tetratricopeptide (TPR) repeat protein
MIISLPWQLTPSELLCCVELSPFIDDLLQRSRSLRRRSAFPEAERCALDALGAGREPGGNTSRGAARMHLADVYREMGRLGPALADCQKAYRIFQNQPSQYQRHNEAITAYALGLMHQLLGSDMDALNWYEEAGQLLERVNEHWAAVNALAQVKDCTCIQRWIATLSKYLTTTRTRDRNPGACICVPIILSNADDCEFAMAELEIGQYIICEREARAGMFGVRPPKGKEAISLKPDAECSTRKIINEEVCESLGAEEEDYALIAWKAPDDEEDADVVESLGESEEYGPFVRDIDGNIRFVRPTPIVIGEEEADRKLQIGDVIALLSPTPSSSKPSTPPPEPSAAPRPGSSTPPPEPSADSAVL